MESHAWLVTSFLCLIGLTALFEGFSFRLPAAEALLRLVSMFAAASLGWHALRRYAALMKEAERFARRSTCERCRSYGAFEVLHESPAPEVRCRKCGHAWTVD
jgi:hypothetical protein